MTVLIAADLPVPGIGADAERIAHRAGLLARRGGGVLLAPPGRDGPVLVPGLRHVDPGIAPGADPGRRRAALADRLPAAIATHRPTVVHAFGIGVALPALMHRRHGVSVIIEPGYGAVHRLRDERPDLPPTRLQDLVELEDKALGRADAVIARTPVEAAHLAQRGVRADRLHTVPDGLPRHAVDAGPLPDLPHVLVIAAHRPDDEAALAIEALARLDPPWRAVIAAPAGWSSGGVAHLVRARKIDNRVDFAVFGDDFGRAVAAAQVVVCPLRHGRAAHAGAVGSEAVRWALAGGRPSVAPDLPVVRAVAGAAARYYAADDAGSMATQIRALLADRAERAALAEQAIEQADAVTWLGADVAIGDLWAGLDPLVSA